MGFRKSLEFLIKDYLINLKPEKKPKILSTVNNRTRYFETLWLCEKKIGTLIPREYSDFQKPLS